MPILALGNVLAKPQRRQPRQQLARKGMWMYADVAAPVKGDTLARVRGLLTAYYAKVVMHPALTLAIFVRPAVFPDHAKRITVDLISLLSEFGLSAQRALRWTHILVDYLHGAALAVAAEHGNERCSPSGAMLDDFESGVAELLEAFARSPDLLSG